MTLTDEAAAVGAHVAGDLADAERRYRKLVTQGTQHAVIYANLGAICIDSGLEEGHALTAEAVRRDPAYPGAHRNMGIALRALGKADDAIAAFARAMELEPDNVHNVLDRGSLEESRGRLNEADASYRKALALQPGNFRAVSTLAGFSYKTARFAEALAFYKKAIDIKPNSASALSNYASVLQHQGRMAEAVSYIRRAVAADPKFQLGHTNLVYTLSFGQLASPQEILRTAQEFEAMACPTPADPFPQCVIPADRKVNIGIISAEIRDNHPVPYFLETFLRNCDRNRFTLTLYPTTRNLDKRRETLVALVDRSKELADVSDVDARKAIIADEIDILIDTTAHMIGSRLPLLAMRCAPIQCHYIGFHGSTGVRAVDYFIGDNEITPPEHESHFSEKIVRLPRLWVAYTAPSDAPDPAQESPVDRVVFGSFNNLNKVSDATLRLWAAALTATPGAQLVLKDVKTGEDQARMRIIAALEAAGAARDRIEFIEHVPSWREHMRLYNRIDVALDTVPLNGGTTSFDALFMGTPVVTLREDWIGGRLSSALLVALKRTEWIADSPESFVRIAAGLASDKRRLRAIKESLRAELMISELCDGASLARALEAAFAEMIADHNQALTAR